MGRNKGGHISKSWKLFLTCPRSVVFVLGRACEPSRLMTHRHDRSAVPGVAKRENLWIHAEVAMTAEDSAVSDMTRKPQTHVNLTPLTSAEASLSTARRDSLQSQSQRAFSHLF